MSPQALALSWSLALMGCGMCGAAPSTEAPVPTPTTEPAAPEDRTAPEAHLPPPDLSVVFETDPFGRRELRVENRGDSPAQVRSWVNLESSEGGGYSATSTRLRLDRDGDFARLVTPADTVECLEIVGGAALILAPWDFITRHASCPAHPDQTLTAGTYRYMVQSCNEQHPFPSSPFVLTEEDRPPSSPCPGSDDPASR